MKKSLWFGRDCFGVKPLFFAFGYKGFVFGSELKSFRKFPYLEFKLNEKILAEFFSYGYVCGRQTLIKGVYRFPPGEIRKFDLITQHFEKIAVMSFLERPMSNIASDKVTENKLDLILRQAVHKQLHSDVPIGVLLSGGVDSSLIAAYASEKIKSINAYHVQIAKSDDEFPYALAVSKKYNLKLHKLEVTAKDIDTWFEAAIKLRDEPYHIPQSIALFLICRFAQKDIKVLLGGTGADELFGGYNRYLRTRQIFGDEPIIDIAAIKLGEYDPIAAPPYRSTWGWKEMVQCKDNSVRRHRHILHKVLLGLEPANALRQLEFKTFLESQLRSFDLMTMGFGLEGRVPYLDNEVVRFAMSLSLKKITSEDCKAILKRLATKKLPISCINRPKVGFNPPLDIWLNRLKDRFEVFYEQRSDRPFYNIKVIRKHIDDYFYGQRRTSTYLLWLILNFEWWYRGIIR